MEKFKYWLDKALIAHFMIGALYPAYVIFYILKPEGGASGPLMGQAATIPFELMMKRRLYAIEFWLISFLIVFYFAHRKKIFNWDK